MRGRPPRGRLLCWGGRSVVAPLVQRGTAVTREQGCPRRGRGIGAPGSLRNGGRAAQLPMVWGPLMEVVRGISAECGGPREPGWSPEQERGEVWLTAAEGWGGAGPRAPPS